MKSKIFIYCYNCIHILGYPIYSVKTSYIVSSSETAKTTVFKINATRIVDETIQITGFEFIYESQQYHFIIVLNSTNTRAKIFLCTERGYGRAFSNRFISSNRCLVCSEPIWISFLITGTWFTHQLC